MEKNFCDECKKTLTQFMQKIEVMKKNQSANQKNIDEGFKAASRCIKDIKGSVVLDIDLLGKHIKIIYVLMTITGIVQLFNLLKR